MKKKYTFFVHTANDANFLINYLDDEHLKMLNLNLLANNFCYNVSFDLRSNSILTNFYPYMIQDVDIRETYLNIVSSIYQDNKL